MTPKPHHIFALLLIALCLLAGVLTSNAAQITTSLYGLFVSSAGNVGILTYAPQEKLTLSPLKNFAVELSAPTVSAVATSSAGGSMATGTYYYVIVARDGQGTTTRSAQVTAANIKGPSGSVGLYWSAIQGATSYSVYRTSTSTLYATPSFVFSTTTTAATDTLASLAAGAPQSYTNAYSVKISASSSSWLIGGNLGLGTTSPSIKLDVNGYVRGYQTATSTSCTSDITGAMFYNAANSHFWGCNGITWTRLD